MVPALWVKPRDSEITPEESTRFLPQRGLANSTSRADGAFRARGAPPSTRRMAFVPGSTPFDLFDP
jgi:molecular chaperone HtpG